MLSTKSIFQGFEHFGGKGSGSSGQNCDRELACLVCMQQGANVRSCSNGDWY